MQPTYELSLNRPWHWGIAIVSDSAAEVPDLAPDRPVAVGDGAIVVRVRHAQDIDVDVFEGEWDWAVPRLNIRSLDEPEPTDRTVLCDVVIDTPRDRLSVGDADGEVVIPVSGSRTRLIVSAAEVDLTGLDEVWIDLLPVAT